MSADADPAPGEKSLRFAQDRKLHLRQMPGQQGRSGVRAVGVGGRD